MGHSYGCLARMPRHRGCAPPLLQVQLAYLLPPSLSTATASQQSNQNPLRSFMLKSKVERKIFLLLNTSFACLLDKIITGFTALKMPLIYLNMYTVHAYMTIEIYTYLPTYWHILKLKNHIIIKGY